MHNACRQVDHSPGRGGGGLNTVSDKGIWRGGGGDRDDLKWRIAPEVWMGAAGVVQISDH